MNDCINVFEVVQGDSFNIDIAMSDDTGKSYKLKDSESLTLSIAHSSAIYDPAIVIENNKTGNFKTKIDLDAGRYVLDVCLIDTDGNQCTLLTSKNNVLVVLPKIGGV